jgi:hypothetical protein
MGEIPLTFDSDEADGGGWPGRFGPGPALPRYTWVDSRPPPRARRAGLPPTAYRQFAVANAPPLKIAFRESAQR